MAIWIIACKELNGVIYLSRLPQTIDAQTPGVPDTSDGGPWFAVGPGLRPSVQEYTGTQFILTFDYLSHMFTRVIDTATWPPTQVNPVQVSGGPNPPTAFTYTIELASDALYLSTVSQLDNGLVQQFYNPPALKQPLLFLDPITNTYSVTIQLAAGWAPIISSGLTAYYRLYSRPYPYTGAWNLIMDWDTTLDFVDSHVGSLRYEYSAIWGEQFNFADQWNPNDHQGGIIGETYITVDSTTQRPSFQAMIFEPLTADLDSTEAYGILGERQLFIVQAAHDSIQLSKSLVGQSTEAFGSFGERQLFLVA